MIGLKGLVGKRSEKTVKFMDTNIKIMKLSVAQVMEIQEKAKGIENDEAAGFEVLKLVITTGAEGADELTDKEFRDFPMDELSGLSAAIMKFSGLGEENKGK
jgi:hypothetical protein